MNDPDRAARHLRFVRDLPLMIESAFRAAIREAVFIRGGGRSLETIMNERAHAHFDEMLRNSPFGAHARDRGYASLSEMVARFAKSPLAKRLARIPVGRIHAATAPSWDLLVCAGNGRRFLIRFAADANAVGRQAAFEANLGPAKEIDGLLIYACETGAIRRLSVPVTPFLRSA